MKKDKIWWILGYMGRYGCSGSGDCSSGCCNMMVGLHDDVEI